MNDQLVQGLCRLSGRDKLWSVYVTHAPIALDLLIAAANTARVLAITLSGRKGIPQSGRIAPLQHLEELYISGETQPGGEADDQIGRFFNRLHSAPSLRVLWIEHPSKTPRGLVWSRNAFTGLVQRSDMGRTLTVLTIWTSILTEEDVIEMIKLLPNLQFLSVASLDASGLSSSSSRLLEYLTPTVSSDGHAANVFLPKLEAFRISLHRTSRLAWRLAAAAQPAETRCRPSGYQKLSRVVILLDDSLREIEDPKSSLPLFIDRLL